MKSTVTWLFDLDNTLHNASHAIFPAINRQMTEYIERHLGCDTASANALRQNYWRRYGATMLGLMRHHGAEPRHFLDETHAFENLEAMVVFERPLRELLRKLPGRKIVFSNGPRSYALRVLRAMRLDGAFDAVFAIENMRFHPKPGQAAFRHLLSRYGLYAHDCVMIEDSAENLRPAKRLGMRTVWISRSLRTPAHVDLRLGSILELRRVSRFARRGGRHVARRAVRHS